MTYKYEIPEGRKVIIPRSHWNKTMEMINTL